VRSRRPRFFYLQTLIGRLCMLDFPKTGYYIPYKYWATYQVGPALSSAIGASDEPMICVLGLAATEIECGAAGRRKQSLAL